MRESSAAVHGCFYCAFYATIDRFSTVVEGDSTGCSWPAGT